MDSLPAYISVTFILTTFLTIGFLFYAIKQTVVATQATKIVATAIAFWLFFTAILATGGFYLNTTGTPPNFVFAPVPSLLFITFLFIFYRKDFIEKLPLKTLTILQVIRVPVEIVLFLLYQNGKIPQIMTFEGRNFDVLAGLTAPIIFWLAFRKRKINRPILILWNLTCLFLVSNIVITAILSLPTAFQQFGLDQPNIAVLYFPYIWLPAIVVPIVLFAHLVSLWQLFFSSTPKT
jgi:hypothetical protein